MNDKTGLIHLYHGDGKGKSTCAFGLALRFAFYGKKVFIVQFLKDGTSGEIEALSKFENVTILAKKATSSFTWDMTDDEKAATKRLHDKELIEAMTTDCDMLILDELCSAMSHNLVDILLVDKLLNNKKEHQELVITGRNPVELIIQRADYITHMQAERHPFDEGIPARKGIEF